MSGPLDVLVTPFKCHVSSYLFKIETFLMMFCSKITLDEALRFSSSSTAKHFLDPFSPLCKM